MPSAVYSRRNVISTRSPICDGGGVDVGQLAPEAAAAVEVDDRDHDRRARRVGQPVDGEGGDGGRRRRPCARGSIWSTAPQFTHTRAGGRWRVPHAVAPAADEAELPRRSVRQRRRARPARSGSGRRGGSPVQLAAPGQEAWRRRGRSRPAAICSAATVVAPAGAVRASASVVRSTSDVGAVGQEHDGDRPGRARPGRARRRAASAGVGGAGVADRRR